LLLWGLPPLALITGLIGLLVAMLRRRALVEPKALDAAERHRLATLVEPGAD
jgi:cytochrome c-type biogenesis protein CcmH/NrfF